MIGKLNIKLYANEMISFSLFNYFSRSNSYNLNYFKSNSVVKIKSSPKI